MYLLYRYVWLQGTSESPEGASLAIFTKKRGKTKKAGRNMAEVDRDPLSDIAYYFSGK